MASHISVCDPESFQIIIHDYEVFLHLWPVFESLVTLGTIMHMHTFLLKLNIKDQRYNMNGLMVQVLGLHVTVSVHL